MFFHYVRGALKEVNRQKLNSLLALLGLSLGLAAALLIFSYCLYYRDYDRQIPGYKCWYRLRMDTSTDNGQNERRATFYQDKISILTKEIPGIEDYVVGWENELNLNLTCDGKPISLPMIQFTTNKMVKMLGLKFVYGSADSVLINKKDLILSQTEAERLFGKVNPVGKKLQLPGFTRFIIAGVFADLPPNQHFRRDAYTWFNAENGANNGDFHMLGFVFLKINDPQSVPGIEKSINDLYNNHPGMADAQTKITAHLDPLTKVHFITGLTGDNKTIDPLNIIGVGIIGILLFIASLLNFINLVLLGWLRRTDEFAFRRAVGAERWDLLRQLLVEYGVFFVLASILGLLFYRFAFTGFAGLVNLDLQPYLLFLQSRMWQIVTGLLVIGLVSGIITSLRFSRTAGVGEEQRYRSKQVGYRIILFVQIAISVMFVISALVVSAQMHYMHNRDLGYNWQNTVEYQAVASSVVPGWPDPQRMIDSLKTIPGVTAVSASDPSVVSPDVSDKNCTPEIHYRWKEGGVETPARLFQIFNEFPEQRGMTLLSGRLNTTSNESEIVVNQTFANLYMKGVNPLGQTLLLNAGEKGDSLVSARIVGVAKDILFFPAYLPAPAVAFYAVNTNAGEFQVTYNPAEKANTLQRVDDAFAEFYKNRPFGYRSLDVPAKLKEFYAEDDVYSRLTVFIALLIAVISILGVFSLSSLHIQRQMEDIAIRKICGAEFGDIFITYAKPYLLWLGTAGLLGMVLAYFLTALFLARFATHIHYLWAYYGTGFILLSFLAITPLYFNLRKAQRTDPSVYLQSE